MADSLTLRFVVEIKGSLAGAEIIRAAFKDAMDELMPTCTAEEAAEVEAISVGSVERVRPVAA